MRRFVPSLLIIGLAASGAVAALRGPMASLEPGRWSVSHSATGSQPTDLCVADFLALGQWEHRGRQCERSVVAQGAGGTVVRYTCPGGDFAEARITVLTPRSLKIETQGIRAGEPFNSELFARKSGTCPHH